MADNKQVERAVEGERGLVLARKVLAVVGGTLLVFAVGAYLTGDEVGRARTHMDAVLVLAGLGTASALGALVVWDTLLTRRSPGRASWFSGPG